MHLVRRGDPRTRLVSMAMAALLVVGSVIGLQIAQVATAPSAAAAPGDAFDQNRPAIFVSSGQGATTLFRATVQADGAFAFTEEGTPGGALNAIGYNTLDNFLYASSPATGQIVKIGQGGRIVDSEVLNVADMALGSNVGVIRPGTNTMLLGNSTTDTMYRVNLATGDYTSFTLTEKTNAPDLTFKNGLLWGFRPNGSAVRVNPTSGQVDVYPDVIPAAAGDPVGAMWTFGNGNLGLLRNATGTSLQISVASPTSSNPIFEIVSRAKGPASLNNDATNAPGLPTDIGLVKTGPASLAAGGTVTYDFTVTNNGPGESSGSTVTDTLPDAITGLTSSVTNCSFTGQKAQCLIPPLDRAGTFRFTISGTVAAETRGTVQNTATVFGNEQDPNPDNNTSTTQAPVGAITLDKTAGTPADANGDGIIGAGDTIPFSFLVTNVGATAVTGLTITDAMLTGAGAAITCPTTALAIGASTTCTSDYTITAADATAGVVRNTATASGNDPNGVPLTTPPDSTETTVVAAAPAIRIDKTHEAAVDVNTSGVTDAGDTVQYTFTVTNGGNTVLQNVRVTDPLVGAVTCDATTLAAGAVANCRADAVHTITAAEETAGTVQNTATAAANPPGSTTDVTAQDTDTLAVVVGSAALTLDKVAGTPTDVNQSGATDAGDTVQFTFTVTNAGNVPVSAVAVTDPTVGAVTCQATTLAVGASTTCSADAVYTITAADAAAGAVNNTATVGGNDPDGTPVTSPPDSTTTTVTPSAPALTLDKTAGAPVDVNASGITDAGDTILYSFTVTNAGNVPVSAIAVNDALAGAVTCEATTLAGGASTNCMANSVYTITAADQAAGAVNNTATAAGADPSGDPVTSPPDTTSTTVTVPAPALTLDKIAGAPVDVNASGITDAGDTIQFTFVLTNTGNVSLTGVGVNDPLVGAVTCEATTLAAGASANCSADAVYTITAADAAAGAVNNTATGTGTDPGGNPVPTPPTDTTDTPVTPAAPALTLDKTAGTPVDVNASGITDAGDTVQFTFILTNTGNVPLSAVGVNDPLVGAVTCEATTLAAGASTNCSADAVYTITAADAAAGAVNNTATGTGTDPNGNPIPTPPTDTTTTTVTPAVPALTLDKTAGVPVDVNASGITDAGDTIQFSFTVTNSGNVPVSAVAVNDALAGAVTCEATTLAAGASTNCTADSVYTVTAADQAAGAVNNIATASGTDPDGGPVTSPPDSTSTPVTVPAPALTLDKTAGVPVDVNASGITDAGDTIAFSFVVTNSGNVPVSAVAIDDPLAGGVTCDVTTLAVGASANCAANAVYTVTEADEAAGAVNNTATATAADPNGAPVVSNPDATSTPVTVPAPALTLDKVAGTPVDVDESGITDAGDTIQYSFTVTNSGNVPVSAIAVTDALVGTVTCDVTALAVGASATCAADAVYTVTEADETAGAVNNTAVSTGVDPDGGPVTSNEDSTSTPVQTPDPKIELDKTAGSLVDANADGKVTPGDTIEFSFLVTNTGNVTLNDIAITDEMLTGGVTCPASPLRAGASVECTPVVYEITQADIDAGSVENLASVTGTPPSDPPVDDGDITETPTPGVGGLSLVKTAKLLDKDADGLGDAGEVVSYTFVITNTGTITVKDVRVDDPMLAKAGVAVRCEASSLAPGASTRCSADYTITKADTRSGAIRNVATAVGIPPTCDSTCTPISSPPADATIPPDGKLAATGGVVAWSVVGVAVMFLLAGGVLIAVRRRRHV